MRTICCRCFESREGQVHSGTWTQFHATCRVGELQLVSDSCQSKVKEDQWKDRQMYTHVNHMRRAQTKYKVLKKRKDYFCLSGKDEVSDRIAGESPGLMGPEEAFLRRVLLRCSCPTRSWFCRTGLEPSRDLTLAGVYRGPGAQAGLTCSLTLFGSVFKAIPGGTAATVRWAWCCREAFWSSSQCSTFSNPEKRLKHLYPKTSSLTANPLREGTQLTRRHIPAPGTETDCPGR